MINGRSVLAVIPARGGSKRLPRKNIKRLSGKPMIAWTIDAAKRCKYIDKIVVSTDNIRIARIAYKFGAEVPFLRPSYLATSSSKTIDVILHALHFLAKADTSYDIVVLLQPTSPLRKSFDIKKALEMLFIKKAKAVVSVCGELHAPLHSVTLTKAGKVRRSIPMVYRINGAVYAAYVNYLKQNMGFLGDSTFAYIMPPERSVDIDNEFDFTIADFFKSKQGKK